MLALMLESPGSLLRAWRLQYGWTQADHADALGVTAGAVSAWERGIHQVPTDVLARTDALYGAGGCLADLARAIGTPTAHQAGDEGWQPRRYWGYISFPAPPGPVWAWIRPAAGGCEVSACVYVSALGMRLREKTGPEGVLLVSPYQDPRWVLHAVLAEAGWVEFGRGVPPDWLGLPTRHYVPSRDAEFVKPRDRYIGSFIEALRARDHGDPATLRDRLRDMTGPARWDALEAQVRDGQPAPELLPKSGLPGDPGPPRSPDQRRALHRRLREARGMSLEDAAGAVTRLLPKGARPVTLSQVFNYESGRTSRVRYLPALLDRAYGAFGWSCLEAVPVRQSGRGLFEVAFPEFWTGPVTIAASPRASQSVPGTITLTMRAWRHHHHLPPGPLTLWYCQVPGEPPLRVTVPPGWRVDAWMGRGPDAEDANDGDWELADEALADEVFAATVPGLLAVIDRTPADLARALQTP